MKQQKHSTRKKCKKHNTNKKNVNEIKEKPHKKKVSNWQFIKA